VRTSYVSRPPPELTTKPTTKPTTEPAAGGPVLSVYAEIGGDGGCLLYTFDPPGLLARGASLEAALAAAADEAVALRRFLLEAGMLHLLRPPWREGESPEIHIVETVTRRGRVADGRTTATFEPDLRPVTPTEAADYLTLMRYSRRRLLALRQEIPAGAYGFRSQPHRLTIEGQLEHIAKAERWYIRRLWPDLPRLPRSRDVWQRLELCRGLALDVLDAMSPEDMARTARVEGEAWTVRKVFRRFLYHEKFHLDTIRRDLMLATGHLGLG